MSTTSDSILPLDYLDPRAEFQPKPSLVVDYLIAYALAVFVGQTGIQWLYAGRNSRSGKTVFFGLAVMAFFMVTAGLILVPYFINETFNTSVYTLNDTVAMTMMTLLITQWCVSLAAMPFMLDRNKSKR